MRLCRILSVGAVVGAVAALAYLGTPPQSNASSLSATQSVHIGVPPPPLRGGNPELIPKWSVTVAGGYQVDASLFTHTWEKAVVINWTYSNAAVGHAAGTSQVISLPYWPTTAVSLNDFEIIVAGKMRRGETVMETVAVPAPTLTFDIVTGEPTLVPNPVGAREYTYMESTVGRDMILFMRHMSDDPSCLLVGFYDSGDVYRFDPSTEVISLQASSSGSTGVVAPELATRFNYTWSGDHISLGYIYVLNHGVGSDTVVLVDSNRDGTIDSHFVPSGADWAAQGLSDPANYTDW